MTGTRRKPDLRSEPGRRHGAYSPRDVRGSLYSAALLIWQLGEATTRLTISVGQKEGERMIETFKRMTVRELLRP